MVCCSALSHNLSLSATWLSKGTLPSCWQKPHLHTCLSFLQMWASSRRYGSACLHVEKSHTNIRMYSSQGCPSWLISRGKRRQNRRVSGAQKATSGQESASLPQCTYSYTSMSWKSLNVPDSLQCSLMSLSTLAVIWLLEIRASESKTFITNL